MNPHKNVANGIEPEVHNASTYTNWGCRCPECRADWNVKNLTRRATRKALLLADPTLVEHGRANTYLNWGCRCPACTAAHAGAHREQQQRRT